jgi:hypothetical protein
MRERNPHELHSVLISATTQPFCMRENSVLMNSGGLPSGAIQKHHRDMGTLVQLFCRSGLTAACAVGILVCAMSGCGKKETAAVDSTDIHVSTAGVADATNSAEGWVKMETLEPGKWTAIDGAADLEWDDENRVMRIGIGTDLNGVCWTGPLPTVPYMVELEARRMSGSDFFCGLTFPVRSGKEFVTFIIGGWGGNLVGISSIDGLDASENSTASQHEFEDQRWYRIRVEVKDEHLQAWIDDQQVVDAITEEQKLSLRPGPIEACAPFGLATWLTSAEIRGVKWCKLEN